MNKTRVWTIVGCCGLALAAFAWSQAKQKPGLWEVTSQMNMAGAPQMPQLPPGVQLPPGMQMPASPFAPHTTEVCVTQAMIDKYGSPYSNPPNGRLQGDGHLDEAGRHERDSDLHRTDERDGHGADDFR